MEPPPQRAFPPVPVGSTLLPRKVGRGGGADRFTPRVLGIEASLRLAACFASNALFASAGRVADLFVPAVRRGPRREARRRRALDRVARTLGRLKGAFAKVGQFAGLRVDVLTAEMREALAPLQDRVPPLPLQRIAGVVESELGAPLDRLFSEFEPEPLGAASIAQVHRARLPDGETVAVKVQYPWLQASLPADLAVLRGLLALWTWRRATRLDARRLFEEFAASLRSELDFENEAAAARAIALNLSHDPQIVVPRIHASHSTRRVLTMSYHRTLPIHDPSALRERGVAPRGVLEILARAYAKQVFVDGLFHADPHPGNLAVLDEPTASERPRLLFMDFGLSMQLGETLHRELRKGILALLQRDLEAFLAGMDRLGVIAPGAHAGVRRSVAAMFERLGATAGPLGLGGARVLELKDEAKALLEGTEGLQLPSELLLYAKTLSYLFGLGARLDPDVDMLRLSTPYLLQFLGTRD